VVDEVRQLWGDLAIQVMIFPSINSSCSALRGSNRFL
jgi:hypothetical protein